MDPHSREQQLHYIISFGAAWGRNIDILQRNAHGGHILYYQNA